MSEVRTRPADWKKRIDTFIRKAILEAFVYFERVKKVPEIEEFRDKALSIIDRDVARKHLESEAAEIEHNFQGKGKEYLAWAKHVISDLKQDKDFLKELKEFREQLIKKLRQ